MTSEYKPEFPFVQDALVKRVEELSPAIRKQEITPEQTAEFIGSLARYKDIEPRDAFGAFAVLAQKGATNAGAPTSMSITIISKGREIEVNKADLNYACNAVFRHKLLRRVAERLALDIGHYALKNNLPGDLSTTIKNRVRANGETPLTPKELVWCSSFFQNLPNLEALASARVAKLLAEDYNRRFQRGEKAVKRNERKTDSGQERLTERRWRAGKPQRRNRGGEVKPPEG